METWIGLLDCNNFFVSCERLFRPDLKDKPVVVLSSNDGCIVARSQEIKDKGIPMGVPHFQVKDILKDIGAVTFSSNFPLYRDVSRRVFDTIKYEVDTLEQYSIDEAFFKLQGDKGELLLKITDIKDRVFREVGVPVSIGLAKSKTLAKYAASIAKKTNGLYVLSMSDWQERQGDVLLGDIWGVGTRTARAYASYSLQTVVDVVRLERRQVEQLFGVVGVRLWQELQGIPSLELKRSHFYKQSVMHTRSFKQTVHDPLVLYDAVSYHVREAAEDLRAMGVVAHRLQVMLGTSRHGDYVLQGGSMATYFDVPTNDSLVLVKEAIRLADELYKVGVPYKKAGVLLSQFVQEKQVQPALFEPAVNTIETGLSASIDALNRRLGKGSVLIGSYLKTKDWESSRAARSPSYTTTWSDLVVVKA